MLTPGQTEILTLFARGQTAKEIARDKGVSYRTVENWSRSIKNVLGVGGIIQAVVSAIALGLIDANEIASPPPPRRKTGRPIGASNVH